METGERKTFQFNSSEKKNFAAVLLELTRFSIPLILSGILQQLYNWADAFIVGNVEGETALGAIGGTGSVTGFYLLAITGFTVGISVVAGQKYGGGDLKFVSDLLTTFSVLLFAAFLLLSAVGFVLMPQFLRLLRTPAEIAGLAELYLKIIIIGVPFMAVYNVFSAVLRGLGDSKAPFYSICVSSGINIVLDILLVAVLRLGIAGAAAATVFSQIVMTFYLFFYTKRKHPEIRFGSVTDAWKKEILSEGFRFGIPPMIQSSVKAGGNLLLQNFMNGFGTATVVAITTAYRIDTLAILPVSNLCSAVTALTAQSFGAGDQARTRTIRKAGIVMTIGTAGVLTALVLVFGRGLIAMFGAGAEATEIGRRFFLRLGSFYVVYGLCNVIRGYLEGIGKVLFSSIGGMIMLGVRIVLSYLMVGLFDNMVIAFAEAFSWVFGLILFAAKAAAVSSKPSFSAHETENRARS